MATLIYQIAEASPVDFGADVAPCAARLVAEARHALQNRVGDPRTEEIYAAWIRRFLEFAAPTGPEDIGELEVDAFLAYLVVGRMAGPVAYKRARRALAFLRIVVLGQGGEAAREQWQ